MEWRRLRSAHGTKIFQAGQGGVGAVTLIQNNYCVPYLAVHEENTEVGTRHHPPLSDLHWAPNRPGQSREEDTIYPGVRW